MPFVTKQDSATLERERNGVWVDYHEGKLKIARLGNPHQRSVFSKLRAPYKNRRGAIPDREAERIVCRCYAETLLLDWKNITDEDGKEYPYSVDNAFDALMCDQDLLKFVEATADDANTFREERLDEQAKKSLPKSSG